MRHGVSPYRSLLKAFRAVEFTASFNGGAITSHTGALPLGEMGRADILFGGAARKPPKHRGTRPGQRTGGSKNHGGKSSGGPRRSPTTLSMTISRHRSDLYPGAFPESSEGSGQNCGVVR